MDKCTTRTIFDTIRDFRDTAELSEYDYNQLDLILDEFEPPSCS